MPKARPRNEKPTTDVANANTAEPLPAGTASSKSFAATAQTRWTVRALLFACLAATVLLLYWHTLPFPFQFDDNVNILENPSVRIHSLDLPTILSANGQTVEIGPNRPVAFYTLALNYYFGAFNPWGYRLVNVLIHALNSFLVFLLVRTVLSKAIGRPPTVAVPFAAALLWAVNPVQSNAVVYIVQRMTSMATLLYLSAFLCYLQARERRRPAWFLPCAVLWFLACGTKEIAYVLPLLVLLWELAFHPGFRAWIARHRWVIPVGAALGLGVFVWAHFHYLPGYVKYAFTWKQHLLTELRVVARYLGLLAFPHPSRLVLDYNFPVSRSLTHPLVTLWALLFHAGAIGLGFYALVRRPLYGFAVLGYYLHLAIESTVIPLDLIFEHRAYLPSVFLAVGAAGFFEEPAAKRLLGPRGRQAAFAVSLGLAVLWGVWTWQRLEVWRTAVSMWTDVAQKQPFHARGWSNLGKEYLLVNNLQAARTYLQRSIQIDPSALIPLANLGLVEAALGNNYEATRLLKIVAHRGYRHPLIFYNLGVVESRMGKLDEAIGAFEEVLRQEPRFPDVNFMVGELYLRVGRVDKAEHYLRRELELNPNQTMAAQRLREIASGAIRR